MSKDCDKCAPKVNKKGEKINYDIEELKKLSQEDTEKSDEEEWRLALERSKKKT
ncbi:MAG: hypothetical protein WED07_14975 [Candidatus Freyarchaeum deiterrae]